MANALQQQISADGGMNMMNQLMSGTSLAPEVNTQQQQEVIDSYEHQPTTGPSTGQPGASTTVPLQ
jgi:hypothetical protein